MDTTEVPQDWRAYYWRVWKALLAEFQGWSEAEVEDWAKRKNYLQGDERTDAWISHDLVACCVAPEIVPALLERAVGFQKVELMRDMENALWPSASQWNSVEPSEADWSEIRRNVEQVVAKYESKLE